MLSINDFRSGSEVKFSVSICENNKLFKVSVYKIQRIYIDLTGRKDPYY